MLEGILGLKSTDLVRHRSKVQQQVWGQRRRVNEVTIMTHERHIVLVCVMDVYVHCRLCISVCESVYVVDHKALCETTKPCEKPQSPV
jgi:hypothetical protein